MTQNLCSRFAFAAVVADMDGVLIDGAQAYPEVAAALARWRRGGLGVAVATTSRDCTVLLEFAGLREAVDVIVEPEAGSELGRAELMDAAARRLAVEPARAVAVVGDLAGVAAACAVGFGLVVAVARDGEADALARAGADRVVSELGRLRFLRVLPAALDRRAELRERQAGRELALFLDFDGTLAPIVDDPAAAALSEATRATLAALAERVPVAIVSGRDRPDVEARVGLPGLVYAGCHGFDIAGAGLRHTQPQAEAWVAAVDRAEQRLRSELAPIPGAIVERKRFAVAAHYRMVAGEAEVEAVRALVDATARETGLRRRSGKRVVELEPPVAWDKGRAVAWILEVLGVDLRRQLPVYVGDDETDEDAFYQLGAVGIGVRVGPELSCSLADYRVGDPDEVAELLAWWTS